MLPLVISEFSIEPDHALGLVDCVEHERDRVEVVPYGLTTANEAERCYTMACRSSMASCAYTWTAAVPERLRDS